MNLDLKHRKENSMTQEEKAKRYDETLEIAKKNYITAQDLYKGSQIGVECFKNTLESIFPELKENKDEKIVRCLLNYFNHVRYNGLDLRGTDIDEVIVWLEKQSEHPIYNVPSREVILAIWDLGNEWKELTNGCISTKYGSQLDYIQKHWEESEYYLREKQSEKPQGKSALEAINKEK